MTVLVEDTVPGLTSEESARRLAADGPNALPTAERRTLIRQTRDVVRQPMLLLLLGAGTVNFLLSEPLDGGILMLSVLVVVGISLYQERKTENALAALRDLSSPRALVVRDGKRIRIPGRDVVRGDVVLLAEGDRVPADAVVVDAVNLSIDESVLTGESVPVRKAGLGPGAAGQSVGPPGGEGTPWVFSGSLVVKGHGIGLVKETGARTELGRIGATLRTIEPERTPLQREVDRLVRIVGALSLVAVVAVLVIFGMTRHRWLEGLLAAIGAAMALLPEEFAVVLTVFLALGAWRMSQRHVLTRRSATIETLGSATAICVDKTGTLTMNAMTVRELVVGDSTHVVDSGPLPDRFHALVEYGALASPVEPFDPMDRAFKELAQRYLAGTEHLHTGWELVREYPLSEDLLAVSQLWRLPTRDECVVAAKGAPEAVAELCHLGPAERAELRARVDAATAGGGRVLAVARARFHGEAELPASQHDFAFEPLGLVGLHDPVRPGAAAAVAECNRAGIRVLMVTGDYPGTALAVAREVGLDVGGGIITGPELAVMDDAALARRIRTVTVFARVVPEQKLRLVRALKANGEVVGMTGDGVNDAPALSAADIGIAMGGRGTDVARESADLVITDDDFASVAGGIRQGRGIYANLRKAMSYIVAVHVPIFGMALIPVFVSGWPLVLLPVQIALLELIIDPACSVVFESEEIDPQVMDQPPRRPLEPTFGRRALVIAALQGVSVLLAVLGVYLWAVLTGRPGPVVRSVAFEALVVGDVLLILVNRSWRLSAWQSFRERRNPTLKWILAAAGALVVVFLAVPGLRRAFGFGAMGVAEWLIPLGAVLAGGAWFELYKARCRRSPPAEGG